MAATLGGDALGCTAGMGEHAAVIRARVCENLGYLGLALDRAANEACQPDGDIALPASTGRILVIATREDVIIVRETRRVLSRSDEDYVFAYQGLAGLRFAINGQISLRVGYTYFASDGSSYHFEPLVCCGRELPVEFDRVSIHMMRLNLTLKF